MLTAPLLLAALVFCAEDAQVTKTIDAPARGSVGGPWALVDSSFISAGELTSGSFGSAAFIGGDLALTGGLGFELGGVRFSPTARFSLGPVQSLGRSPGFAVGWSPLALAIAAPDLFNDQKVTGLRLTPVFGVTVPTAPGAFGAVVPLTTLSIAGQLERRFGVVELAYRLGGNTAPCLTPPSSGNLPTFLPCATSWAISHRLFAEAWFSESFSVALGVEWSAKWSIYPMIPMGPGCLTGQPCDVGAVLRAPGHTVSAQAIATWAFTERFGTSLQFGFINSPAFALAFGSSGSLSLLITSATSLAGSLSVWFRTDQIIQRNWLDR